MRTLGYFIGEALRSILRSRMIHAVAVGTVTIAFVLLGAFLLLYVNLQGLLETWSEQVQVTVYLAEGLSAGDLKQLEGRIRARQEVAAATHLSKEQALAAFKRDLQGQRGLLEGLGGENPLPASFELRLHPAYRSVGAVEELVREVRAWTGVAEVQYGQEWIANLTAIVTLLHLVGLAMGGLLALALLFIVANTIKLMVYARRDEIEVLSLVGATAGFIKAPFLIEGTLQGMAGALLALLILSGGYHLLSAELAASPLWQGMDFRFLPWSYGAGMLVGGMAMGVVGSLFSLGRFLKV